MQTAIIDDLRSAFDATTVLTGSDIDPRYYTDISGIPVPPPIAVEPALDAGDRNKTIDSADEELTAMLGKLSADAATPSKS